MKLRYIIITGILACSFSALSQPFSSKEKIKLSERTDSILSLYMKYATFTIDANSISSSYIKGFTSLFTSPQVVVLNDLDPTGLSPKEISVNTYINYVEKMYPDGLSVDIPDFVSGTPKRQGDNIILEVEVTKEIQGYYMDRERYHKEFDLKFFLNFNQAISQVHIYRIASFEIDQDSLDYRTYIREADSYYKKMQYESAIDKYEKALLVFSNAAYPRSQVRKCAQAIDKIKYENRKPIYVIVQIHPAFSSVGLKSNENLNLETKSGFGLGGGIGFEMDLFHNNSKSIKGGFGIGIHINSMKPKLLLDSINETIEHKKDIDGDEYCLLVGLQTIDEKLKITYLDIPLYFQTKFGIGEKVFLNVKIGLKIGLAMSTKYTSGAIGDYRGMYDQYNNIILYGNELEQFGYPFGKGPLSVTDKKTEAVNSMNLSVYAAVGIGFKLSKRVGLFANVDYAYGLSKLFNSDDNYHLSTGKNDLKSLGGYLEGNASLYGLEIGLNFSIN